MLVPKLAICMIYLFHSNAVKFNFLKKLFGCVCFDLDPETEWVHTNCRECPGRYGRDEGGSGGSSFVSHLISIRT